MYEVKPSHVLLVLERASVKYMCGTIDDFRVKIGVFLDSALSSNPLQ